jgi:hypothetical protein
MQKVLIPEEVTPDFQHHPRQGLQQKARSAMEQRGGGLDAESPGRGTRWRHKLYRRRKTSAKLERLDMNLTKACILF